MIIHKEDIISEIRTAIDDIAPSAIEDSFADDVNRELWQAVAHAATELSVELPVNLLDVTVHRHNGTINLEHGNAFTQLPDDYLRFVGLDVTGWIGTVRELMEQGSDVEKMQRSPWTRGTTSKPKAMLDNDEDGHKVVMWWPGGERFYNAKLSYVCLPTEEKEDEKPTVRCAIRDEARRLLVWRAASIFFEGKKEGDIAEKFRTMSTNY